MACQYWYDGKFRTEEEFKQILENGLLDELLSKNNINLKDKFEISQEKLASFNKQTIQKSPVTVRILQKIQRNLNNGRQPGQPEIALKQNPQTLLQRIGQPFKLVIKVNGELYTGQGTENQKIKEDLLNSELGIKVKENLTEGIPYMLVPSAYGLYPVRLFNNLVKNTSIINALGTELDNLRNETNVDKIKEIRKRIESNFYRITVEFKNNKYIVSKYSPEIAENITATYDNYADVVEFLGEQVFRVDYLKINKEDYNTFISNAGAVTTDLFAEDGNLFNSSSFVLEAYKLSPAEKQAINNILTVKIPDTTASKTTGNSPITNTANKTDENPIFNTPIDELNESLNDPNIIVKYFTSKNFPKDSSHKIRVIAKVVDSKGKPTLEIQSIKQVIQGKDAEIVFTSHTTSSTVGQEAINNFFNDSDVKKKQAELEGITVSATPVSDIEGTSTTKPKTSIITAAAEEYLTQTAESEVEETVDNILGIPSGQTLEDLMAVSGDIIANEEDVPTGLFDDVDEFGDDADSFQDDNIRTKLAEPRDTPEEIKLDKEKAVEYLKKVFGENYTRRKNKTEKTDRVKGNVRMFRDFENLKNYLPKETWEMLVEARRQGKVLHGLFTEAAMYLWENTEEGTTYHEAFHVVFNLALPLKTRMQLINEAYEKYKDELPLETIVKNGKEYKQLPNYKTVEELLADKFVDFTIAAKELEGKQKSYGYLDFRSEVQKSMVTPLDILVGITKGTVKSKDAIAKQFVGMYKMLKGFYTKNSPNIDDLFENINLGTYANKIKFKNTSFKARTSLKDAENIYRYENPIEREHAFTYLKRSMEKILDNERSKIDPDSIMSEAEIINKIGVDKFYSLLLTRLAGTIAKTQSTKPDIAKRLYKLYQILTEGGSKSTKIKEGDTTFYAFTGNTILLELFNNTLKERNIYITLNNEAKNYNGISKTREEENTTIFDDLNEGTTTEEQSYDKSYITVNARESLSHQLKNLLSRLPKYKSNRKNASKVINSLGVEEYEKANVVYSYLISKLSNSYTMKDMMDKLKELNRPYIKDILAAIDQNPKLATDFWVAMGQKNYATFMTIQEDNGVMKVFRSNRRTLDSMIRDVLISEFLDPSNKIFVTDGKYNPEIINLEEANKFYQDVAAMRNASQNSGLWQTPGFKDKLFKDIEKVLSDYNISVTEDQLHNIWIPRGETGNWRNIGQFLTAVENIAIALTQNSNPFTFLKPSSDEVIGTNLRDKENAKSLVEKLANILQPAAEKEVVSSFRNIDDETVYNLIASGFINKQFETYKDSDKLNAYLEKIGADQLMSEMPFIKDLQDTTNNLQQDLDVVILDGFTRKGKRKSAGYTDMSDIELETSNLAMYSNSNARESAYYKLPIPADKSTLPYVKAKKYTREEVVDKLTDVAALEFNRIITNKKLNKSSLLRLIPNYFKNSTEFKILGFLNGKVSTTAAFNRNEVRAIIDEFLSYDVNTNGFLAKQIEKYKDAGIITGINEATGEFSFVERFIDTNIKKDDRTTFFKDYLVNTYYMNTQLSTLLAGDPSFYKNLGDIQKRFAQVVSPGTYGDTSNLPTYYKAIILNDSIQPTEKQTADHILSIINSSTNLTPQEKKELSVFWTAKTEKSDGNNETDGATYIHPNRRKEQLESLNRWTPEHEQAHQRILAGKETIEDLMLINPPFKPEKPFIYTQITVAGKQIPIQIKNAETVLTRSFAETSPELMALYNDMEAGKFTVAMFESAVKVGGVGNSVNAKGKVRFGEYNLKDGKYVLSDNTYIYELPTEDWRLQQETPSHYIDERAGFGTQIKQLILGDLNLDGDYNLLEKTYKGRDIARIYQNTIVQDLKESYKEVEKIFLDSDNKLNWPKITAELRREVIARELGQDYLDAIQAIPVLANGEQIGYETKMPLYHPMLLYTVESLMNSIFRNRITKQKIKGGNLINTTSFGVSNKLRMITDPVTGTITYQALLPHSSKKYFPLTPDGKVDIEFIKEKAPDLLRIIGYRIPTEDKYSMFNIEIVGFTPPSMGGTVILPIEITTIAGLDFDIDKLYFMAREFYVNSKGIPKVIEYVKKPSNREEALSYAENIYSSFKDLKRFLELYVKDKETIEKILDSRRQATEAQINNEKTSKEIEGIKQDISKAKEVRDEIKKLKTDLADNYLYQQQQEIIDDLYEYFNEEVASFDLTKGNILKLSKPNLELIADILESKEFNATEYSTKKSRDNLKIDIIQSILSNKNTATAILNPGNFESLKDRAAKIRLLKAGKIEEARLKGDALRQAAEKLDVTQDLDFNYPSTQLELFNRNMMGKKLIGIFANHNVHHAKAQYTNLRLKNPLKVNNKNYQALNNAYVDGKRISRILATDLAAVVDNAKDPIASFLNMNTYTANTIALLERLGIDEDTVFAFINQPSIIALTKLYYINKGSMSEKNMMAEIRKRWTTAAKKRYGGELKTAWDSTLNLEELEKNITPQNTKEYYEFQLQMLNAFDAINKIALELNEGIMASKIDVTGLGINSSANFVLIQKQQAIYDKISSGDNLIEGLDEMLETKSNQLMNPASNLYGIIKPINIMNQIFPSIGVYNESNKKLIYSVLGNIKRIIGNNKLKSGLTEKEAKMVDTQFLDFISSAFPFFNYSQAKDILQKVPERLQAFKKSLPADSPLKDFVDQLYIKEADNTFKLKRIEFYNTGKTPAEIEAIKYLWERMIKDSDPDVKTLGLDLIKYTYFAQGFGFSPYSFAKLIPLEFWTDKFQRENNILSKEGTTFNRFLRSFLDSNTIAPKKSNVPNEKLIADEGIITNRFIDQFIKNNAGRETFVPTIEIGKYLDKNQEKELLTDEDRETAIVKLAREKGSVKTSKGAIVMLINSNKEYFPFGENNPPVPYIKETNKKGEVKLYKYVERRFQNPLEYGTFSAPDVVVYQPVNTSGYTNFILEYDYYNDIIKPVVIDIAFDYNDAVKGAPKKLGDQMLAVENALIESAPDLMDLMAIEGAMEFMPTTVAPVKKDPNDPKTDKGDILGLSGMPSLPVDIEEITKNIESIKTEKENPFGVILDPNEMPSQNLADLMSGAAALRGIEISSNAKGLAAALTNPTELAKSKDNLTQSYPIEFNGKTYKDVESAYQSLKDKSESQTKPTKENSKNYKLMVDLITAKLQQHPRLVSEITKQGGSAWILASTHQPTKANTVWETGGQNWFIEALNDAYLSIQPTTSQQQGSATNNWEDYRKAMNDLMKINKEGAIELGLLSQEEFLSLSEKEQKAAIWQIKNC